VKHWVALAAFVWFEMAVVVYVGGLLGVILVAAPVAVLFAYGPDWGAL
jgi:hypothetical protein